jgi:hypothetical protein
MTTPDDFLAPGGRLSARLPGWEARPQQMEMANLIAAAIAGRRHAIVEAGTGVGKSLAYLVPAVLAVTADQVDAPVAVAADTDAWDDDEPSAVAPAGARRPRRVVISTSRPSGPSSAKCTNSRRPDRSYHQRPGFCSISLRNGACRRIWPSTNTWPRL